MIGEWFTTDFDESPATLDELPLEVSSGRSRSVALAESIVRGRQIIGRVAGAHNLIALRWRGGPTPVRVSVRLQLDEVGARAAEGPVARLVAVRVGGAMRGCALLGVGTRSTVEFELPADEVADGLLLIELADLPTAAWADGRFAAKAAPGVRIDSISVRPSPAEVTPFAFAAATGLDTALLQSGAPETFLVKGPPAPKPPAPPPPSVSQKITRKLGRAAAKAARTFRRAPEPPPPPKPRPPVTFELLASDPLTGASVELEIVSRDFDGVRLRRPTEGPLLLGLADPFRGKPLWVVP